MLQILKIILIVIIIVMVVGCSVYLWQNQKHQVYQSTSPNFSTITIMVPENYDLYTKEMTDFAQVGGKNPLETTEFVKKSLKIPYTDDLIKASAQAAAREIAPGGGPPKASIAYLKIKQGIAYVLLDIDIDGWAGVSVSLAIIHPLVEKTLLQFSQIKKVVFDYTPEDKAKFAR